MNDLEREARFVLRRLIAGARLEVAPAGWLLVGRRAQRTVSPDAVSVLRARGFVECKDEAPRASDAGRIWLSRGADDDFAARHRVLRTRLVKDAEGREHYVVVNAAESPIALLRHRGLIGAREFEAGERLRRDFTLAQLTPRLCIDYASPIRRRAGRSRAHLAETALAAKQRFNRAMRAAGPGLSDVLFDVCCMLRGLDESEQARGWPRSSARVVLRIALERLAFHYGMPGRSRRRIRSWRREAGAPAQ